MKTNLKAGAAIAARETAVVNRAARIQSIKAFYRDDIGGILATATLLKVRAVATHADADRKPYPDLRCVLLVKGEEHEEWINGYELSTAISFAYGEGFNSSVVGELADIYRKVIDADRKLMSTSFRNVVADDIRADIRAKNRQAIADADDPDALMAELYANLDELVDERIENEQARAQAVHNTAAFEISRILRGIDDDVDMDNIPTECPAFDIINVTYQPKLGDKLPNGRCEYAKDKDGNILVADKDWKNAQTKCIYAIPTADGLDVLHKALVVNAAVVRSEDDDLDALLADEESAPAKA